MTKAGMIESIIQAAKSAAIVQNKAVDVADMFFTLAFTSEEGLQEICKKLGVRLK